MKCIYHAIDHDGQGSAALVKLAHPEAELIGLDYNWPVPWERFTPGETVFVVDFALQPVQQMKLLHDAYDLIWIDHHFTAIRAVAALGITPKGIQRPDRSAIELVWEYLHPEEPMPEIVRHIGAHDRWIHTDPLTLPLHYGLQLQDTDPNNTQLWRTLFTNFGGILGEIAQDGAKIEKFVTSDYANYATQAAFDLEFEGLTFLAANRGLSGSKLFDSVFNPDIHDAMLLFYWSAKMGAWRFSLYTDKDGINVGDIAVKYGGGGHEKAAGFRTTVLPFNLPQPTLEPV